MVGENKTKRNKGVSFGGFHLSFSLSLLEKVSAESLHFELSFPGPDPWGFGAITEMECDFIQEKKNLTGCVLIFRPEYSKVLSYIFFHF